MQQAWVGLVLSLKEEGERPGTSTQGQGDQPLALPFSLGLLAVFCCLSWRPALITGLYCFSRSSPLGLEGHCRGRKEGVAHQKVQEKVVRS